MVCSRSMVVVPLLVCLAACGGGTSTSNTNATSAPKTDDAYLKMAQDYVAMVTAAGTPWTGPTTGPTA